MTEDEAKLALFQLHQEYMSHGREERLKLYDEYKQKRSEINNALAQSIAKKQARDKIFEVRYNYALLSQEDKENRYEEYRNDLKEAKSEVAHIKRKGIEKK